MDRRCGCRAAVQGQRGGARADGDLLEKQGVLVGCFGGPVGKAGFFVGFLLGLVFFFFAG